MIEAPTSTTSNTPIHLRLTYEKPPAIIKTVKPDMGDLLDAALSMYAQGYHWGHIAHGFGMTRKDLLRKVNARLVCSGKEKIKPREIGS